MYKLLSKFNAIAIIPFEQTFYYAQTLPKSIKLSKELIELNYSKFAPFKNPNILTLLDKKDLMLWFFQEKSAAPIVIPESYLFYKELKNRGDAIYLLEGKVLKVIVIKNAKLLNSFVLESYDENILQLSKDEYSLDTIIRLQHKEVQEILQRNLHTITISDALAFLQINIDKKVLFKKAIENFTYPIVFFILLYISISYFQGKYLDNKIENLESLYLAEKGKNKELSQTWKKHNKIVTKYAKFRDQELIGTEALTLLKSIYTIFKDDEDAYLTYYSASNFNVTLKIATNLSSVSFLNRLSKLKYIKNVAIQRIIKQKRKVDVVIYDIELKKREDIK